MGQKEGVESASQRINEIIQNVQERDGVMGGRTSHSGSAINFGHWEGPSMSHRGSLGGQICSEEHLVPANKTGLVIGKGPTPSHLLSSADHQSFLQEEKPSN